MSSGKEWDRNGSFMKKPSTGWLHDDHALMNGDGIFYAVRYVGSMRMDRSMRTMDFNTRTEVTREAIKLVCEAAGLLPPKKRKVSQIVKETLTHDPLVRNWDVKFTISTGGIALVVVQTNEVIANHIMPAISFATGGSSHDYTTLAYVAKDSRNVRECHVFECSDMAQEIMATIGQAFELRYKAFLKKSMERQNMLAQQPVQSQAIYGDSSGVTYQSAQQVKGQYDDLPEVDEYGGDDAYGDMDSYGDTGYPQVNPHDPAYDAVDDDGMYGDVEGVTPTGLNNPGYLDVSMGPVYDNPNAQQGGARVGSDPAYDNPQDVLAEGRQQQQRVQLEHADYDYATDMPDYEEDFEVDVDDLMQAPSAGAQRELSAEPWFHGQVSRAAADSILQYDGDFFVRESMQSRGQYILSAMHKGEKKHLLLVDPSGQVRTKDMAFDSVSHLINYHLRARLPIISRGSRIVLGQAVRALPGGYAKLAKK
ncbi:hypothetical protein PTSG_05060 [Salpingoeca rosetta]|uniref:SHC-transforming protein 1 n=1 Tax=Salpingoeca rosetta (strain ATCC 50818 / BSB-021) TaxID=946362 RepID=F2U9E5_SALR5|nr:uncharacterized protein PTSG_05060 [Salpingoeca rosetta]EGD73348.1 hypothetical protein PTSG_05060 [Salpingoeca rosetta]|eukprot:XP_004994378.1 hypothetical protein PTSG_05060 [Salpingoeca rosetta]